MSAIGFDTHNHDHCIGAAVAAVEAQCDKAGLQFTPVRRRVLEILLEKHAALGAYDILDVLRGDGFGAQPPVAYRALDFLVKHGFAHKIERLNAFIACCMPDRDHTPIFLICRDCNSVAEASAAPTRNALQSTAEAAGFVVEATVVEATGLCPNCAP